ncbi:MAG: amidohydrolase family protein [Eubacteriales bacterium]|nr:amidohydrolase family protein [Eubacteriales bacterium]MDD4135097.1 amidohydrolase family protein [Eubacteriales bacterium]
MQIIIKNGLIVDGTGKPPFTGDIRIQGDRIREIGSNLSSPGARVIDATGKLVIPGLIDPHLHEEWICFIDGTYELLLRQGVTTTVNGNCGHSIAPGPTADIIEYYYGNGLMSQRQRQAYLDSFPQWDDFEGYAKAVEQKGTNINLCTLMGHGTLRWTAMGGAHDRAPNPQEEMEMARVLEHNLAQGAFGISYGLDYVPGRYAKTEELVYFAKLVARAGGVAAAHLRHCLGVKEATEEFLEVGRQSGVKLQVSHLKASCPEAFDAVLDYAGGAGAVLVDTIPASTAHCQSKDRALLFMASTNDELFDKGLAGIKEAVKSPEGRALLRSDPYFIDRDQSRNTLWKTGDPAMDGKSVEELAQALGQDPKEYLLDLFASDRDFILWCGGAGRRDFSMEIHGESILANPYVCAGGDEILGDPEDPFDWYELLRRGAMPIFIKGNLKKGMPLEEVIRRNTSMVADHFSIAERGRLAPGNFADIAVIDLERYAFVPEEEVTPLKPNEMARGVELVLVNGKPALEDGSVRFIKSGRVLRRGKA